MSITIERHEVAFLKDGEIVEHEIEIWGVDKLRAELEARRIGARGTRVDVKGKDNIDVTDLGDMFTREALNIWAACVRTGLYDEPSVKWRTEDYVGSAKLRADGDQAEDQDVDPTQSDPSTGSD